MDVTGIEPGRASTISRRSIITPWPLWLLTNKLLFFRAEGVRGLYKGFFVSTFQVVSGMFYVSTYEGVRHILVRFRSKML